MKRVLKIGLTTLIALAALMFLCNLLVRLNYATFSMQQKWQLSQQAFTAIEAGLTTGKTEAVRQAVHQFNAKAPEANQHEFNSLLHSLVQDLRSVITNEEEAANTPSQGMPRPARQP